MFPGDAGRSQGGGLFGGRVVRQSLDHIDQIGLGVESLGAAVGQQRVEEGVVRPGFEAAKKHPVPHAELGGPDHVFDAVGVDLQNSLSQAVEDFVPVVDKVAEGLADVAGRTLDFELLEREAMNLTGDGQAAAAPDEFAASVWSCGLPRLFLDEVDLLDVKKNRDDNFGRCVAKIVELAACMSETASVIQAEPGGDGVIDDVAQQPTGPFGGGKLAALIRVENLRNAAGGSQRVFQSFQAEAGFHGLETAQPSTLREYQSITAHR